MTAAYQLSSRLAAASPADITNSAGTTWTYWDLLGPDVGRTEPGKSGDGLPGPCRGNELAVRHPSTDFSSLCPDNNDWLNFVGTQFGAAAVIGAVRVGGELWLAWTAARGGGFAHPHVQVLQIDTSTWKKTKQWQIWNADHAFAPPSLALNSADEVGIALAWGGGGKFCASFAIGILGDFVVWFSEASNATDATNSGAGSNGRWGDHVTCRQPTPTAPCSPGLGTAVLQKTPPAVGTQYNPRYILFGRRPHGGEPGPIG